VPTWDERELDYEFGGFEGEIVVTIIVVILGYATSLFWIGFTIFYKDHTVIVASTPSFSILILIGSLISYSSVFTFMPAFVSPETCLLKIWLLAIGYIFLFGALFVKTWRVVQILYNKSIEVIKIPNSHIWSLFLILLTIMVVLLSILSLMTDIDTRVLVKDEYRASENFLVCTTPGERYWVLFGLIVSYVIGISLFGLFLMIKLCFLRYKLWNESKTVLLPLQLSFLHLAPRHHPKCPYRRGTCIHGDRHIDHHRNIAHCECIILSESTLHV